VDQTVTVWLVVETRVCPSVSRTTAGSISGSDAASAVSCGGVGAKESRSATGRSRAGRIVVGAAGSCIGLARLLLTPGWGWLLRSWHLGWVGYGAAVGCPSYWLAILSSVSSVVTVVMLMLFAIQHLQARDQTVIQRKLDELLRAVPQATIGHGHHPPPTTIAS